MFKLDSNKVIRINRGDTKTLPLFINIGSLEEPMRYKFIPTSITIDSLYDIVINLPKFIEAINNIPNTYLFVYDIDHWTFQDEQIDLFDFGINVAQELIESYAKISITYSLADSNEVYFYILLVNSDIPVLFKKFMSNGTVYSERYIENDCGNLILEKNTVNINTVNSYGDMLISLSNRDTKYLKPGEYRYQIKCKISDTILTNISEDGYRFITLTDKLPLYIIDDDTERDWSF